MQPAGTMVLQRVTMATNVINLLHHRHLRVQPTLEFHHETYKSYAQNYLITQMVLFSDFTHNKE